MLEFRNCINWRFNNEKNNLIFPDNFPIPQNGGCVRKCKIQENTNVCCFVCSEFNKCDNEQKCIANYNHILNKN